MVNTNELYNISKKLGDFLEINHNKNHKWWYISKKLENKLEDSYITNNNMYYLNYNIKLQLNITSNYKYYYWSEIKKVIEKTHISPVYNNTLEDFNILH